MSNHAHSQDLSTQSKENSTQETPLAVSAATKYKTLARAVAAMDAPACYEIFNILKEQGKDLSFDEVNALGMRWFMVKTNRDMDVAKFLKERGFEFDQVIILDQEKENVGTRIPFRLIGDDDGEKLLIQLINENLVSYDISDGIGDGLLIEALQQNRFDFSEKLLTLNVNIDNTNMSGQSALHVFASRLNFQAIQWLGEHKADPTIEDLQGARASEMVPESMNGWDPNSMFDVLEDFVVRFRNGKNFEITPEYSAMLEKEKTILGDDQTLGNQADEAKSLLTSMGL